MDEDPFNLRRFVSAQDPIIAEVRSELDRGRKTGHWMWFVFPQIEGLGLSPMARFYGISSLDEAKAYLAHPTLGPRLLECTTTVNALRGLSIGQIFGNPDDLKFKSCMTLFAHATAENQVFLAALRIYFDGAFDGLTLARL
jgi:uncharacterized protein (DUF1810 family)